MVKSRALVVSSANFYSTEPHLAKSITFVVLVGDVIPHPSLGYALNITEETQVCMDLDTKVLKSVTVSANTICSN